MPPTDPGVLLASLAHARSPAQRSLRRFFGSACPTMVALSLVERELRLRARQPLTMWLRLGTATAATLLTLSWTQAATWLGPAEMGRAVFAVLTWLSFGVLLFEGMRQTVDSLSGEQREGTLGLLFLTELGGLDIVLGKLAAASLHALGGLLAMFPVLGIGLAVGGITAGEFWRTQLALLTTLLVAGCGGLWVSARSHDPLRAVLAGVGLILALVLLPLAYDGLLGAPAFPSLSPAMGVWLAGDQAYTLAPARFWWTQIALVVFSASLLLAAGSRARKLGRTPLAQSPTRRRRRPLNSPPVGWNYRITPRLHARPSSTIGDLQPARWLAASQRGLTPLVWLAILLPTLNLLGFQWLIRFSSSSATIAGVLSLLSIGFDAASVALLALLAARPLWEARRSGVLELLLCTPVTGQQIVRAHWSFLWRKVRLPLTLSVGTPVILFVLLWFAEAGRSPVMPWGYLLGIRMPALAKQIAAAIAACWMGLWLGTLARSLSRAVGQTLLLVVGLPWLAGTLTSWLLLGVLGMVRSPFRDLLWFVWSLPILLTLAWLLALVVWTRRSLTLHFREWVSEDHPTPWWPWTRRRPHLQPALPALGIPPRLVS